MNIQTISFLIIATIFTAIMIIFGLYVSARTQFYVEEQQMNEHFTYAPVVVLVAALVAITCYNYKRYKSRS